ncbi:MAG: sulfatase-like hydrolase/transferase, partial [Draconibacterium sp.]|nr:sulfatase-like hydrolase/transferase [Draconibacterium sp.]
AMSCAGNSYLKTPAMDKLAESGIRFTNNYVVQPLCLPFRSSLQTSRYPHEIGTISNSRTYNSKYPMLGILVAEAGYKCDYFGKWHIACSHEEAGYPNYDKVGKDPDITKRAVEYLKEESEQPFFLTVSLVNPHNVCQLARADADGSDLPDGPIGIAPNNMDELPPLPDNFEKPENEPTVIREIQKKSVYHYPTAEWDELTWRQYLWGYYRLVEKVDKQIGEILQALNEGGHADNTVIIFTSDHGEGVARHHWNQKQILYDQATKTPFIIHWKGTTKKGVYSKLVCNALDIPVTILDVAGASIPTSMHGKSMLPVMKGLSPESRKFVVTETMFARGSKNLGATGRMIRTERFKYCIYDNGEKREQLFDMENDPGEMSNLVYDEKFEHVLNEHRGLIASWAEETKDTDFPYHQE